MQGEYKNLKTPEDVLSYIIERECTLLEERLRELTHSTEKNEILYEAVLHVYRLATAMFGPNWKRVEKLCPEDWKDIQTEARAAKLSGTPDRFLSKVGLLKEDTLVPMEPDLMGEYFVYAWLTGEAKEQERRDFLRAVWGDSGTAAIFFDRLFRDYAHLLNEKPEQWGLLLPPLKELVPESARWDGLVYAWMTVNATGYCNHADVCQRITDYSEQVYRKYPGDREISWEWASGMVNLMAKQDEAGCTATLARLKEVYNRFPNDREIAVIWAIGLVNLMAKQDEAGCTATLARLEEVYNRFHGDREFAVEWAMGLVNLMAKQDEADCTATLARLEEVYNRFHGDREFAVRWAKGLDNLMAKQSFAGKDVRNTFRKLKKVYKQFPDDQEMAVQWAKGLFFLSITQPPEEARHTLERIRHLLERFPGDRELANVAAMGQGLLKVRLHP